MENVEFVLLARRSKGVAPPWTAAFHLLLRQVGRRERECGCRAKEISS